MRLNTPPRRRWLALGLAIQLAWGIIFIARTPVVVDGTRYFTLFDDAMISMRYARNFAEGHGLVWNAGDAPVEGYSNFLWTLGMAALHRVAPEGLVPLLVSSIGLALLLINIGVVWATARRLAPDLPGAAPLAAIMVACIYSLGYWTLRGMEAGLLALLIDVAVLGVLSLDYRGSTLLVAVAVALLPLVRADGALPALLIGGYACVFLARGRRRVWWFLVLPLAAIAAHTALRVWYYGDWMPNTYYLKMTGAPPSVRLRRGVLTTALEGAWALWPIAAFAAASRPVRSHLRLPAIVAVAFCAYSIYVGGDAWEWTGHVNRYLVCALPAGLILAAIGIERLAVDEEGSTPPAFVVTATIVLGAAGYALAAWRYFPERELSVARPFLIALVMAMLAGVWWLLASGRHARRRGWFRAAAVSAVLLVASGAKVLEWIRFDDRHVIEDRFSTELGLRIGELTQTDARIAVFTAGAIPYFSRRWSADLLGKNDPYIARQPVHLPLYPGHDKWDYQYSVATYRPDVIDHLWRPSSEEMSYVLSAGYESNAAGILVRRDSGKVDGGRLLAVTEEIEERHAASVAGR